MHAASHALPVPRRAARCGAICGVLVALLVLGCDAAEDGALRADAPETVASTDAEAATPDGFPPRARPDVLA